MSQVRPSISTLLTSDPPHVAAETAERLALEHFGIKGAARPLTSERDLNFRLTTEAGAEYVFKIMNSAEPAEVTDLQTRALRHVARTNPELPVQAIVPSRGGEFDLTVQLAGNRPNIIRMLTYLQGVPLHTIERRPAQRRDIARRLAELGLALRGFFHPAAGHELMWDIKNAGRLRAMIGDIPEADRRPVVEKHLDTFATFVEPVLPKLRAQIVHNDFNPYNILIDARNHDRVTGILDFGDVVHTALVNDLAVAAAYQLADHGHPLETVGEFVAAYHRVAPLEEAEIAVLYDLIVARLVTTIVITGWRAQRYPANRAYILRNNPAAWAGLMRFSGLDRDEARDYLRRACGME
jgi:Ser/Thr protein kinase RdoA (MazF antagonist)